MYLQHKNFEELQTLTLNARIWKSMSVDSRKADIKTANTQKAFARSGMALAESTQTLLHAKCTAGEAVGKQIEKAIEIHGDWLALLGHTYFEASLSQCQGIQAALPNIAGLSMELVPTTPQWLFGRNLVSMLKAVKELDRLMLKAVKELYILMLKAVKDLDKLSCPFQALCNTACQTHLSWPWLPKQTQ